VLYLIETLDSKDALLSSLPYEPELEPPQEEKEEVGPVAVFFFVFFASARLFA
jgi:hypothetical protein